jgi:hypothetical protein
MARLGGNPQAILAIPLILRDKLAAILYCDSSDEEVPPDEAAAIEVLVLFGAKIIDLLALAPKAGPGRQTGQFTQTPVPQAAAPAPVAAPVVEEGPGTVMMPPTRPQAPAAPRAPAPPPRSAHEGSGTIMMPAAAPAAAAAAPADQKAHEDAKRFARLVVSEIKLYNEAKVAEGRRNRDLYERLKEDIERGRQMYSDRVQPHVRDHTNYFYDELVRILAGGDPSALGMPMS